MSFGQKLRHLYFDLIYNAIYDHTVARVSPYRRFQERCLDKLQFERGSSLLCVGIGTGNEVLRILERNAKNDISITGVDVSPSSLSRSYRKALRLGQTIKTFKRDARSLGFNAESFDKVVCIHLMDFLDDNSRATREIIRVLKSEGQFVITYPFGNGMPSVAAEIRRSVLDHLRAGGYSEALRESLTAIGAGIAYAPMVLWMKANQVFHSRQGLEAMFGSLGLREYHIEKYTPYQDFIVYGRK